MRLFECCRNCQHHTTWIETEYTYHYCECQLTRQSKQGCQVTHQEIRHPWFMGGSKRCECYERRNKQPKKKFEYPKQEEKHGT